MIRKPEDLPENATDKHFAEECCRYEQTAANSGSAWRRLSPASVMRHGIYSIPGMALLALQELHGCTLRNAPSSRLMSVQPVTP